MSIEIWKVLDFIGYYNYAVSNFGRVKSLGNGKTWKGEHILKQGNSTRGYLQVCLYKDGKPNMLQVHRLVAMAFIPNPDNLPQVNHKNEDKTDNRVENLEFCDSKYNNNYGTCRKRSAEKHKGLKHSEEARKKMSEAHKGVLNTKISKNVVQLTKDGILIASYPSTHEVQRQTGYNHSNICDCCNGKRKSAYGYIWRYSFKDKFNVVKE
jgi:hypothetical protein